jgi:hypothetical protein
MQLALNKDRQKTLARFMLSRRKFSGVSKAAQAVEKLFCPRGTGSVAIVALERLS